MIIVNIKQLHDKINILEFRNARQVKNFLEKM